MMTNNPPIGMRSSSVLNVIARPANAPPRASEPVSPIKILAGDAFHHRKPAQESYSSIFICFVFHLPGWLPVPQGASSSRSLAYTLPSLSASGGRWWSPSLLNRNSAAVSGFIFRSTGGQANNARPAQRPVTLVLLPHYIFILFFWSG